jgi:phage baseplate assembly protein W
MANTRYRGFSTINQVKKFRLTDAELVKRDLINHFSIRKGQKLMNPDFGSIIWNMLYEPLTADVKSTIVEDVRRIVSYDPRLQVNNVILDEFEHGLQIQVELTFLPGNYSEQLLLSFNSSTNTLAVS